MAFLNSLSLRTLHVAVLTFLQFSTIEWNKLVPSTLVAQSQFLSANADLNSSCLQILDQAAFVQSYLTSLGISPATYAQIIVVAHLVDYGCGFIPPLVVI